MQYSQRLTRGLDDKGTLIDATNDVYQLIDTEQDCYLSTYLYNEEQTKEILENGTVRGITEVVSNKLWFDFDSEVEPTAAKEDAHLVYNKLRAFGIQPKNIIVSFSGNKGFGIEVLLNEYLTPKQVKNICFELAKGLNTFDVKMYNSNRILRVLGTKHQKTGLYKIPLEGSDLISLTTDEIMDMAKEKPEFDCDYWESCNIPDSLFENIKETTIKEKKQHQEVELVAKQLDFDKKPKFLSNCRWALQNGFFKDGERNTALLCLASTYKNLGFENDHVYRLLKGVAELQSKRNNSDRYPDEEIWNNICMQVFSDFWQNGQYSCREEHNWLHTYCHLLGENTCNHKAEDDLKPKTLVQLNSGFKEYVMHIEENTIKTGLKTFDDHVFLSTGANVGIIGAPGSGKTSLAIDILEKTSSQDVISVCASLDMARNRFFEKILYRVSGMSREELYELFRNNQEGELLEQVQERFKNVYFFKKSSPTVADIKEYVLNVQEQTGKKVKLLATDYFERIVSDVGDDTAASKRTAGELQDLVDDLDICNLTFYQPNKAALMGGPDQPIYDYTKIKGSSFIYQALRIIVSLWRPFYNPKDFSNDHYMQMAVLKNDLGELAEFSFGWKGKQGLITELEDHQHQELEELLREKAALKEAKREELF